MQEYLTKFTEKVIIATRSGDLEQEKIINELNSLLKNKPEGAAEEMSQYLEFLVTVASGEETDAKWETLPKNLKDIFGDVMEKFKGANIFKEFEDLTKKSIIASKSNDDEKINIINELESIISQKPEDGSQSVVKYLEFLIELARGNDVTPLIPGQDKKLVDIYNKELEKLYKSDMMRFFTQLTEMAFRSKESENARVSTVTKLQELQNSNPPGDISNYINVLVAVSDGTFVDEMKNNMAAEMAGLFTEVQNKFVS